MTRKVTSITKQGKTEPFYLQVAERQIAFHKSIFKFGFNPDIDNALETVWAQGGLYTYLTSASTLYVSSSSANDTAAGTGAQNVTISGLDADYNEVSVTVDLNGQTAVQLGLANNWIRVNRGVVNTSGTTGTPKGVMLSHENIVQNIKVTADRLDLVGPSKRTISYLPVSHVFERVSGYYCQMMGISIFFAESIIFLVTKLSGLKRDS